MTNLSVFIDSLCETGTFFDEDFESKICENVTKIFDYFVAKKEVFSNSCLKDEDFKSVVINIILCDNDKIHEINRDYRHVDRPTDVISFALFADSPQEERFVFDGEINLGDVFLSLEKTKTQSAENNVTFNWEFYYLISHSILHLLGFDHLDDMSYDFMVGMQKEALEYINV